MYSCVRKLLFFSFSAQREILYTRWWTTLPGMYIYMYKYNNVHVHTTKCTQVPYFMHVHCTYIYKNIAYVYMYKLTCTYVYTCTFMYIHVLKHCSCLAQSPFPCVLLLHLLPTELWWRWRTLGYTPGWLSPNTHLANKTRLPTPLGQSRRPQRNTPFCSSCSTMLTIIRRSSSVWHRTSEFTVMSLTTHVHVYVYIVYSWLCVCCLSRLAGCFSFLLLRIYM